MMVQLIGSMKDVSLEWLTYCLKERHYIPQGHVVDIQWHEPLKAWSGTLTPMTLVYQDAADDAPRHLIFKEWHPTWVKMAGHDFYFYEHLAPKMPQIRTPALYYVQQGSDTAFAIYENFSIQYQTLEYTDLPPLERTNLVIDTLAQLHAHAWDRACLEHPQLVNMQGGPLCMSHMAHENILKAYDNLMKQHAPKFITAFGDALDDSWRFAFDWAVEHWLRLARKRVKMDKHLTLIHGDLHWHNLAFHRESSELLIFDWETYKRGLGAFDVAYFIHDIYWKDARQHHEKQLLENYHVALMRYGVSDYTWQDFIDDYRLALVTILFVHMQWRGMGFEHKHDFIEDAIDGFYIWDCQGLID